MMANESTLQSLMTPNEFEIRNKTGNTVSKDMNHDSFCLKYLFITWHAMPLIGNESECCRHGRNEIF